MPRKWTGCLISTTNHSWIRLKLRPEPLAENSTLNCDPRRDDRHATRRGAAPPKRLLKPAAGRVVKASPGTDPSYCSRDDGTEPTAGRRALPSRPETRHASA